MSKKILFTIVITFLSLAGYAQNQSITVSGIVRTADGQPAEHINVILKGTNYGGTTDSKGYFRFQAPEGSYTIVVFSMLAHRKEFPAVIKSGDDNYFPDLTIIEELAHLEQVVVTGQLTPKSLTNSVYKVKAITAEQIEYKGAANIENLLNTEIGIRMSNDMALGETDFELMGMGGNNVKVLLDGVPLIDRMDNKQSLTQIDINTIERVEIVEGPMSVAYGTDALAGVINIITKKGKATDKKRLSIGARIQEETIGREYSPFHGSGNHIQSVNVRYDFGNGVYVGGNFTHNHFGGWQGGNTGRSKEWPSKTQYLSGIQAGIVKYNYDLMYRLDYLNENILKKGNIPANGRATDTTFISNRFTHQLQGNWKVSNRLKLSLATSYQDFGRDKESIVKNFVTGEEYPSTAEGAVDETNYSVIFARTTALWRAMHNLDMQLGLEYQHNEGAGDKVEEGHTTIDNAALFIAAEYSPFRRLDIRPGVRSSYNSVFDAPKAIPSLNTKFRLTDRMDIRASYGRGFRAPTLQELYYRFYHTNGGGFWITGNPNLKAEESDSYMASWTWRPLHDKTTRLTTSLSGFFNNFKNRILMVQDVASGNQTYFNSGKYQTVGATFENTLVFDDLTATVNLSYIGRYNAYYEYEEYKDTDQTRFRFSPEVSASITYSLKNIATFNIFYKFTGARHQFRVSDGELILAGLDGFHWADLTVSRGIGRYFTVNAGVKNIFDVTRVRYTSGVAGGDHGSSSIQSSFLGSGRSYFIGIAFKFNT